MSGKYMKVKRVIIPTITMILLSSMLFGCAATSQEDSFNMLQQTDQIELEYAVPEYDTTSEESAVTLLPWLQLSSLESHPELRAKVDGYFGVTGTVGNKEGGMYTNSLLNKTDQNTTLYLVMTDYNFLQNFLLEKPMVDLGKMALEHYADIEADDVTAPYATINAYFELLPDQEEGQFDGDSTISRAQAMALVMRATTPVNEAQAPEVDAEFTTAVGESQYTDFAAPMNKYAYINTNTGLNEGVFNTAMSKGEYICMLTNFLVEKYDEVFEASDFDNKTLLDANISVVKDAGSISYAEAIKDDLQGVPSDMYATFTKALQHGLLPESLLEDWSSSITKAEAIELFMDMTANYVTRCQDTLVSAGNTAAEEAEAFKNRPAYVEGEEAARFAESEGYSSIKDWVHAQGGDTWSGWTVIYENGKGAGDQPSYAKYMNPNSPLYGTIYHVGDYMPNGNQFTGTDAEWDAWTTQDLFRVAEEEGCEITQNEDGNTVIVIN